MEGATACGGIERGLQRPFNAVAGPCVSGRRHASASVSAILAWHWRDPMEGLFPAGLLHATGVPRRAGQVFARISRAFGRVELAENAPDVVVALDEERRAARGLHPPCA